MNAIPSKPLPQEEPNLERSAADGQNDSQPLRPWSPPCLLRLSTPTFTDNADNNKPSFVPYYYYLKPALASSPS